MTHSQDSSRPIPLVDVGREHEPIREELLRAVTRVLASGRFILGDEVATFEAATAAYLGSGHSLGTSSGSDSLLACLMALDLEPDDEVLCPAFTFIATAGGISRAGAKPVFADVSPLTLDCRREDLESRITPHTRAIVAVHLFGRCSELDPIVELANDQGLVLIEDTAQALGASSGGRKAGTRGDAGCFSFYPTKNLGAYGDGGACVTSSPELAERIRALRNYGWNADRSSVIEGFNSRLDEIQAAILRVKLRRLSQSVAQRRRIAGEYRRRIAGSKHGLLGSTPQASHAYHLFVIRASNRPHLVEVLRERGIGFGIHYPVPVHLMPAYEPLGCQPGDLPVSEAAAEAIVSLPMFPELEDSEIANVADALLFSQ